MKVSIPGPEEDCIRVVYCRRNLVRERGFWEKGQFDMGKETQSR